MNFIDKIRFTFANKRAKKRKFNREEAIVVTEGVSSINECYNTLKDNLLFMCDDGKNKVIQVESSYTAEGKTTTTCNLAVSLSFNKKKVVVVDLDFRKPRVHRLFKVKNENGLVDFVSDKITLDDAIKNTEYEGLDIITRGSPIYNPSFLLSSERFKKLIEDLRAKYDFVLLDSPPVLQLSDYIHISKVSDGVLFVVSYGKTSRTQAREAAALLKKDNINVIGAVMTFVDKKDPYSTYYGSYRTRYGYDQVDDFTDSKAAKK
ncbi:MAG: CpsD/CapB family tyrosine-protein kinase [Christensenellaceae bacterium]